MWFLIVPFVVAAIGAAVYAQLQPNRYRSTATVLVTPPQVQVGNRPVGPSLTLSDRLRMLQQEVLNRSRLERIISDFDLYRDERETGIMEDVIAAMRRDIDVSNPLGASRRNEGTSFTLSFTAEDPRLAQRVAERLTALFIDENVRQRETIAEGTDQFLSAEVETARVRLEETEGRLEEYKRQFGGQLPDQLQSNLSGLQGAQTQIQTLNESISRDRAELLFVERQLNDLLNVGTTASTGPSADGPLDLPVAVATPYDEALAKARATLDGMLLRLTPDHPDVARQRRIVAELEERANAAQLQRPLSPGSPTQTASRQSPAETRRQNEIAELRARARQLPLEIEAKQRQIEARQAQVSGYQARIEAAPVREAELISLTRDYETLRDRYNQLLTRSEDAKVAANMERRQVTEQFRIVDPPRVPERPLNPNRLRTTMMGAMAGLGLGAFVVALLEYRDRSFRTESDVVSALALPVVAVVPAMVTSRERRRQSRRRWMLSATGLATVIVGTAVLVWKFGL
jgi:polysaccharide chain length determinant protein (PEP-CTERM system associated)